MTFRYEMEKTLKGVLPFKVFCALSVKKIGILCAVTGGSKRSAEADDLYCFEILESSTAANIARKSAMGTARNTETDRWGIRIGSR